MIRPCMVILLAALPGPALADDGGTPIRLAVGETREIEVGYARLHQCDDPEVVRAEMRDKTSETNVFVVTGLRAGMTRCRAGLDRDRPTFLFAITVTEPTRPTKKPAGPPPKTK